MTEPETSIIIVNWNSKALLKQCLASIYHHCTKPRFEVIVVDGGSFDGCGAMLADAFPQTHFIQLQTNVGFGQANNAGVAKAQGEFLLLLNPDTELQSDAITQLRDALLSLPRAGLVAARLLNHDGTIQTTCAHALPTPINQTFDFEFLRRGLRLWGMQAFTSDTLPVEVEAVSGACMMLRRSEALSLGPFASRYFMYAEDMDLCLQLRRKGLNIYHIPAVRVTHFEGGSSKQHPSTFSTVMMRQSLYTYFRANYGPARALLYRVLLAASAILRIPVLLTTGILRPPLRRRTKYSRAKWLATLRWSVGGGKLAPPSRPTG